MASLKSVLKNSKTKIIILEKKHIDSLNIIEIDSLKLRIPFHEVKILDSNINDKYVIVNCVSGEIDGDPIVRNWLVKVHKGYSIKWQIRDISLERGRCKKFLTILLKLLPNKQGNLFGFFIDKEKSEYNLFPWIIYKNNKYKLNKEWIKKNWMVKK